MTKYGAVHSAEWASLAALSSTWKNTHIRDLDQSSRGGYRAEGAGVTLDYSRARVDDGVLAELFSLARAAKLEDHRAAMFRGDHINTTEDRSVLHTALRRPVSDSLVVDGHDVVAQVHEVLARMRTFAESVRSGQWIGYTGKRITHVVNIGIGGSDLGPVMAYEALRHFSDRNLQFHFVSNVDSTDIAEVLRKVDLEHTLFIVASKTFTTQETMMNATTARDALCSAMNSQDPEVVAKHFVAVSVNAQQVSAFGINTENMFGFWDWVGGRYSMESAIGLSTMIAIGPENFDDMLRGFHAMDQHFYETELESNLPVILGLLGVWNRSFLDIPDVAVLPYDQYLKRFPAYLQQLIMESNGKSVSKDGAPLTVSTGAMYWGEPGTNGQHSFYQLLHQGTSEIACDILIAAQSFNPLGNHHEVLMSNALAQAKVFAFGRSVEELTAAGVTPELIPHKVMPGNRPTNVIMVKKFDPYTLGAVVAMYEHMVFVQGVIWGINSFDQWGVELGKERANRISQFLTNNDALTEFDEATARSIEWYRNNR